jgi:hypothetical protein
MIATMNQGRSSSLTCYDAHGRAAQLKRRRHTTVEGVTYKVASNWEEREGAFRLVYEAYRNSGLVAANPMGMRVLPYHLEESATIFVATRDQSVIYTVSLFQDDELGLPLQSIYPDDVAEMRRRMYLAEVSCLAGRRDPDLGREGFHVFVNLMGLMAQYARRHYVDRLLVAVHPRHVKFYQNFFGFQSYGSEKTYGAVQDNPAVGCFHDFAQTDRTGYRLRNDVYQIDFAPWELCGWPMQDDEQEWFGIAAEFAGCEVVPLAA